MEKWAVVTQLHTLAREVVPLEQLHPVVLSMHPDWFARSHVIIVGIPALEFRVLSMLQNILLALEVWVVEADEGPALHTDRVHSVHEPSVLEVVTVTADLQLSPSETFPLIEDNLYS